MLDFGQSPQRTILYYPTISVPGGVWLRRALLYWDQVASIVPAGDYRRFKNEAYTRDVENLVSARAFREIYPQTLFEERSDKTEEFVEELEAAVTSDTFRRLVAAGPQHS